VGNILQETEIGQKFDEIDNDRWKERRFLKRNMTLRIFSAGKLKSTFTAGPGVYFFKKEMIALRLAPDRWLNEGILAKGFIALGFCR
jgi:hypothetical protein